MAGLTRLTRNRLTYINNNNNKKFLICTVARFIIHQNYLIKKIH